LLPTAYRGETAENNLKMRCGTVATRSTPLTWSSEKDKAVLCDADPSITAEAQVIVPSSGRNGAVTVDKASRREKLTSVSQSH
jgi:hypothetical protein